jgi:hypothetical protein
VERSDNALKRSEIAKRILIQAAKTELLRAIPITKGSDMAETDKTALDVQVAGSHYKNKRIQPVEYIVANDLTFLEGCIVKRITRWRDKPANKKFEDLEKIKHEIDLLIQLETKYPRAS